MDSQAWIELALQKLGCSQKELAIRIGVSPTQISKWKNDEHMSFDMERRFQEITGIGTKDPSFVIWAGSLENAQKWENLIKDLSALASELAETGYNTPLLDEDIDRLCWHTLYVMREIGIEIPKQFPVELDIDYDNDENFEPEENAYSKIIYMMYRAFTDLYGFYAAYIYELTFDEALDMFDVGADVESHLLGLAACKIPVDAKFAPDFVQFKRKTLDDYRAWLGVIKEKAFRSGVPLKAEILDLVNEGHDALGQEAEAESLGFNESRLHPDVYMNELLVGMRTIHQVLPAILKKLQIDEKEFILDTSKLRLS